MYVSTLGTAQLATASESIMRCVRQPWMRRSARSSTLISFANSTLLTIQHWLWTCLPLGGGRGSKSLWPLGIRPMSVLRFIANPQLLIWLSNIIKISRPRLKLVTKLLGRSRFKSPAIHRLQFHGKLNTPLRPSPGGVSHFCMWILGPEESAFLTFQVLFWLSTIWSQWMSEGKIPTYDSL